MNETETLRLAPKITDKYGRFSNDNCKEANMAAGATGVLIWRLSCVVCWC